MSYRVDKNPQTGNRALVIDGWQNGIAQSPYQGIANIRNVGISYYPGVAYVNYRRQAATINAGTGEFTAGSHSVDVSNNTGWSFGSNINIPLYSTQSELGLIYILDSQGNIFKQDAVNGTSFTKLTGRYGDGSGGLAYWNKYLVVIGGGLIEFCGDGTGDAGIISTNWNLLNSGAARNTATITTNFATFPNNILFVTPNRTYTLPILKINDPVTFTTTGTLPAPLVVGTTYYIKTIDATSATFITISATLGGAAVILTTDGTGVHTITDNTNPLPLGNCTAFQFSASLPYTSSTTSATIDSYVNPIGATVTSNWLGATGTYNIIMTDGTRLAAVLTNGSATITFLSPIIYTLIAAGGYQVELLDTTATTYKTWVSKVDGNLYFANARNVGRILAQNDNIKFNPALADTYAVNVAVTEVLQPTDTVVDLTDLKDVLIISGQKDTYSWDYVSATPNAPSPVGETISSTINILGNLYTLAGQKGSIYISNGYSAQLLCKIPDYIAGVIDPVWTFGGTMFHRSKLFFQALATTASGTKILAGIFSIVVSAAAIQETPPAIIMEAQNSSGLVPSTAVGTGVLIDNTPSANGNDSYYSGWGFGASATGGIDYNDTTLWQNYEPVIETDIIPIGTILEKETFGLIEFKLDRLLANGDSIRLSWRANLTDSYTVLGTTTATASTFLQLSDYYQANISQSQWAQFKVEFKCASSSSSFIPLREIRLHYNQR